MLNDYAPDMIIISAGFDSCIGDPLVWFLDNLLQKLNILSGW
jgi:hypothetical protein